MASALKRPRHVDPQVWALVQAVRVARDAVPYSSAEARLLDGVHRYMRNHSTGAEDPESGQPLRPEGPRWAAVLALVTATARLCGEGARRTLAPWCPGGVPVAPAPAPGVSPHAGAAAGFGAGVVDEGLFPGR